jgi:hypothetical protein
VRRALVASAVLLSLLTPQAFAQSAKVERLPGHVFQGYTSFRNYTVFDELFLWGLEPQARLAVRCACPLRGGFVPVSGAGIADLGSLLHKVRLRPGASLDITVGMRSGATKTFSFRIRRRAAPVATRTCAPAGSPASSCVAFCPAPPDLADLDCEGAGQVVAPQSHVISSWLYSSRGVRVRSLVASAVPPGASLGVVCTWQHPGLSPCPFGARVHYTAAGGRVDLAGGLRHRWLSPGTVLETRILKGNFIGRVLRLTVPRRGQMPRIRTLCMYPTESRPRACP